ncbi:MAG: hypothetical protein AAGI88_10130 [Pseudomonadota bacterium]
MSTKTPRLRKRSFLDDNGELAIATSTLLDSFSALELVHHKIESGYVLESVGVFEAAQAESIHEPSFKLHYSEYLGATESFVSEAVRLIRSSRDGMLFEVRFSQP